MALTVKSIKNFLKIGAVAAIVPFMATMEANSASRVQIGVLNCTVEGGIGLILGSSKEINCVFEKSGGPVGRYTGTVRKFGVDIGVTSKSFITWAVFAPSEKTNYGALAGGYVGVSAEATVGAGLGANVLVGGLEKSIALQPVSVQAQRGFNIAAGIGSLSLRFVGN